MRTIGAVVCSSPSASFVSTVLASLESSQNIEDELEDWWITFSSRELGWSRRQPWNAFVSILVEIALYNLKNLRFNLGEPSILNTSCSCGTTSVTTPLLSHLRKWVPFWFCSKHLLQTYKGRNFLASWLISSAFLTNFVRSASFCNFHASLHTCFTSD